MSVLDLARPEIRALEPYSSARMEAGAGAIWLNANESAWPPAGDGGVGCNRYPQPQPSALVEVLRRLYGVAPGQLLVTRGSDDGIDLLVRAFCRAGVDAILIQPPTFGMYATSAHIQGAEVISVPLAANFVLDVAAVLAAVTPAVKLVFVCAPNNPSGQGVAPALIRQLASALAGRALLVVDEAYIEFADTPSVTGWIDQHSHLVVLRTLSKAWALAGARVGCVLAQAEVIGLLRRIMAPYPLPLPSVCAALAALSADGQASARAHVKTMRGERARMRNALRELPCVLAVLESQANFLSVRFVDPAAAQQRLVAAGVVVRDVRRYAGLADALRITIGTAAENDRVLELLREPVACV